MTLLSDKEKKLLLVQGNIRRRSFDHPTVDPIKDAMVISEKVQRSGCFGAVVSLLAIVVTAVLS